MVNIDQPHHGEILIETEQSNHPVSLTEVKVIKDARGETIKHRADLARFVESPLLQACEILYDKNIQTTDSSVNVESIDTGNAGIVINFDTLSPENQEIAKTICQVGPHPDGYTSAGIKISVNKNTTEAEIKEQVEAIARQFKIQSLTWSPSFTIEQMREKFGIEPDDENYDVDAFVSMKSQPYYDPDTKRFYLNEEHFEKIKASSK